jgi:hypothetical protein
MINGMLHLMQGSGCSASFFSNGSSLSSSNVTTARLPRLAEANQMKGM